MPSNYNDQKKQKLQKELNPKDKDFFNQLQAKEKREGTQTRGGGHGWTTFIEVLLGDW